jgi:P4 family phage/plasmid primase-like protien
MRSHSKIRGCMSLVSSAVNIKVERLDSDPLLLNTPSGIVDLKTSNSHPYDPLYYFTKITKYAPNNNAAPMWDSLLDIVTCGDKEYAEYLQYAAGMALVGRTYDEAAFITIGDGANGKSTFFNALFEVLGDYAGRLPARALTGKSSRFDLAGLFGKRFVLAAETEEGQSLSNSMLKQIASTDTIIAEKKGKDSFEFAPSFTAFLCTNFLPNVDSGDKGTWRRIKVLPFNAVIAKANQETDYLERMLEQSGGAILQWAIDGAVKFVNSGRKLPGCAAVENAIQAYKDDNDWLRSFIEECCTVDPNAVCMASELYTRYKYHAESNGELVRSMSELKRALEERGFNQKRGNKGKQWTGIALDS